MKLKILWEILGEKKRDRERKRRDEYKFLIKILNYYYYSKITSIINKNKMIKKSICYNRGDENCRFYGFVIFNLS